MKVTEIPELLKSETSTNIYDSLIKALDIKVIDGLEIELRVGLIKDKYTDERIDIGALHPVLLKTPALNMYFVTGVPENVQSSIYARITDSLIQSLNLKEDKKFEEEDTFDKNRKEEEINTSKIDDASELLKKKGLITEINDRVVVHRCGRIIYRENQIVESVNKINISTYNIHFPNKLYDMRLSISEERKMKFTQSQLSKHTIIQNRDRTRKRIEIKDYFFDFTCVSKGKQLTYEVEVEVANAKEYLKDEFIQLLFNLL